MIQKHPWERQVPRVRKAVSRAEQRKRPQKRGSLFQTYGEEAGNLDNKREEIILRAICQKVNPGGDFFTEDDILAVAGIDQEELEKIVRHIPIPPLKK